jgi:hypothetical protein
VALTIKTNFAQMKETSINKMLLLILVALCIGIGFEELKYNRFERYDWRLAVTAEKGQVVEVCSGYFSNNHHRIEKEGIIYGKEEKNSHLSGSISDSHVTNTFYPDSCSIQWFSYTENKFYEANIPLSKELIKRITKSLRTDQQKKFGAGGTLRAEREFDVTFYAELKAKGTLTIGVATYDFHEEIISVQAHEIEMDWNKFKPCNSSTRHEWVDLVISRYNWDLDVDLPEDQTIDEIKVNTFADIRYDFVEEKNNSTEEQGDSSQTTLKAIPNEIRIWIKSSKRNGLTVLEINFDEKEIHDSFSMLRISEKASIILNIDTLNGDNTQGNIVLKQGNQKIKLEKTSLRTF